MRSDADVLEWLTEGDEPPPKATEPSTTTKACPYCAETILAAAKKCRHCGEFLEPANSRPLRSASPKPRPADPPRNPGLAAVLSFLIPGLGQVYNGEIMPGILLGIICVVLYVTVILGLAMHVFLIADAYRDAKRFNLEQLRR